MSLSEDIARQFARYPVLREVKIELTNEMTRDMFQIMKDIIGHCQKRGVQLKGIIADVAMDRPGRQGYQFAGIEVLIISDGLTREPDEIDCLTVLRG